MDVKTHKHNTTHFVNEKQRCLVTMIIYIIPLCDAKLSNKIADVSIHMHSDNKMYIPTSYS